MYAAYEHFSRIAPKYTGLRTTDLAPVRYAVKKLGTLKTVHAADVGCGSGRYDRLLFQYLKERLQLVCVDDNEGMLRVLQEDLCEHASRLRVLRARARALPLASESLDCMFTFNAVHHFKIEAFLNEAARILKPAGLLFIYTRTRSQNNRHIWGKYFPQFYQKEDRLFELFELHNLVSGTSDLRLEKIRTFQYSRAAGLDSLLDLARNRHYSTFDLYKEDEFEAALVEFERRLLRAHKNPNALQWTDENLMLTVRKMA